MDKRSKEFYILTSIFYFVSELACVALYVILQSDQVSVVAALNFIITIGHIYLYKETRNKDYQIIFKKRIFGFAFFYISSMVTGPVIDLLKDVKEELKEYPNYVIWCMSVLVVSCMIPVLWMFYNLLIDQDNINTESTQ